MNDYVPMSDLEKQGRQLWEAVWGKEAEWMKLSDPQAYYKAGEAESAFNLWCHENLPAVLDTLAAVRDRIEDAAWLTKYQREFFVEALDGTHDD